MAKEFTIYSGNGCKYCTLAKLFITANGGKVTEKNIDNDPQAREEWNKFDVLGVPVIVAGDEVIVGFTDDGKNKVADLMGLN